MGKRRAMLLGFAGILVGLMPIGAQAKSDGGYRIVVSMPRHQLTIFQSGRSVLTTHISGGGEYRYSYRGKDGRRHHGKAHTPRGSFRIYRKTRGPHRSYLGTMYNPLYFAGGYAIHGSPSVPKRHRSHGCIRVPMRLSRRIFRMIPIGTPVTVS